MSTSKKTEIAALLTEEYKYVLFVFLLPGAGYNGLSAGYRKFSPNVARRVLDIFRIV